MKMRRRPKKKKRSSSYLMSAGKALLRELECIHHLCKGGAHLDYNWTTMMRVIE